MTIFNKLVLSIIMTTFLLTTMVPPAFATTTIVRTDPQHALPFVDHTFTINITVTDVTNLHSWQITLFFDPTILNVANVSLPPDNIFAGYTIFSPDPIIDNTTGRVTKFVSLEGTNSVSGTGKLCTISFRAKSLGVSTLIFQNLMKIQMDGTYLLEPDNVIIPFETTTGIVEVNAPDFHQNIFDVTQNSETFHVVVLSNSTISNFYFNESSKELTYNASGTDYTQGASIVTIPKSLLNQTLIVLLDNIAIRGYSSILKTLPENATHSFIYFNYQHSSRNIRILLTVVGDINGDRKVDIRDLAIASGAFGSTPGSPRWNPAADVDHNDKIDIRDIAIVSQKYGEALQP